MVRFLIGIDEVGRGPLAGPVTVCALAVDVRRKFYLQRRLLRLNRGGSMKDSKRMTRNEREEVFDEARMFAHNSRSLQFAVSHVSATVIDRIRIVRAVRLALARSLQKLSLPPTRSLVLLDGGIVAPVEYLHQETITKGDQKVSVIALASVVAKVCRDRKMARLARKYPGYGFENHVGYGTRAHYEAIKKYGLCEIHRRSFLTKIKNEKSKTKNTS